MMGCMQIRRERCKTVFGFLSVFVRTRRGFQNQRNLLLDERCLSLSFFFSFLYFLFENTNEFVPQCDASFINTFFTLF